jgi:hypothetical protein
MKYKIYGALVASLGAVVLMLAANETSARSGGGGRGGPPSAHAGFRPGLAQSFRHHRGAGGYWPVVGDYGYGPNGEPLIDATQPASRDVRYTYTYDVPWDWAHRYPPAVVPSDRPYISSCTPEAVTVPGRGGSQQTVNITRCY